VRFLGPSRTGTVCTARNDSALRTEHRPEVCARHRSMPRVSQTKRKNARITPRVFS